MTDRATQALKDNTLIIVLGASGDLAKKKTFPALFGLYSQGLLPKDVHIVGYARTKMDPAEYEKRITSYIKPADGDSDAKSKLDEFKSLSSYVAGSYDEDSAYQALEKHLKDIESKYEGKERHRLFYMALPPSVFIPVAQGLKKNCYTTEGVVRVIVEKPFGKDTESCAELLKKLKEQFTEDETFRIDHYLGKEMVKNMLVSRFANVAFCGVG